MSETVENSKKELSDQKDHIEDLKESISKEAEGPAKKELKNILKKTEKKVADLKTNIDAGEQLIKEKDSKIEKIDEKIESTDQADVVKAKEIVSLKHQIKNEVHKQKHDEAVKEAAIEEDNKHPSDTQSQAKSTKKKEDVSDPSTLPSVEEMNEKKAKAQEKITHNQKKAEEAQKKADELKPAVDDATKNVKRLEKLLKKEPEESETRKTLQKELEAA